MLITILMKFKCIFKLINFDFDFDCKQNNNLLRFVLLCIGLQLFLMSILNISDENK